MKSKATVVVFVNFGALLLLIGILGIGVMQRTAGLYKEIGTVQQSAEATDQALADLRERIYLTAILARESMLDADPSSAAKYREQLAQQKAAVAESVDRLRGSRAIPQIKLDALQREIDAYEQSIDPIQKWSPEESVARRRQFFREKLIPGRQAVLDLAHELSVLNTRNRSTQQDLLERSRASSHVFMRNLLALCLGLGAIAVIVSGARLLRMEQERRQASAALAAAREEESRRIARELHDDITQKLALLSMDLGKAVAKPLPVEGMIDACRSAQRKVQEIAEGTRHLSHRLHPAILEDLGLADALEDLCSDFEKRSGIPVQFEADGLNEQIHPSVAFCLYRIAQESLTNVSKYAQARDVLMQASVTGGTVQLTIADSGVGFDTATSKTGLGLRTMKERAGLVNGDVRINSTPGGGTRVVATVPVRGVER